MNAGTAVLASNRFRLGNKENQIFGSLDLGKVDFGARMYDPFVAGWTTADPLAAKYGSISPYSYCGGNLIRRFDNNDMDWWEIDETGRVVNSGNSKDCDSFYMVKKGEDGSYVRTGVSIDLNYQSVLSHRAIDYSPRQKSGSSNDPKIDTYDVFKIRGDNNGTRLFEFLADNITKQTGVEISHAKTGLSGNKGLNFISFGHAMPKEINNQRIASEFSMSYLLEGQLLHGYTIRELNHSHPFSNKASLNDNNFAQKVKSYLLQEKHSIPSFNVYYVKDKAYYPFGM